MKTIREVCKMTGVSRRALQGYESKGLVAACGKNKLGYLLYDEKAVKRIRDIRQYQNFGFSLKEIGILLTAADDVYCELMQRKIDNMELQLKELGKNILLAKEMIKLRSKS